MDVIEAYEKAYITDQEEESIKRYLVYQHTAINILADFKRESYINLKGRWDLPSNTDEIKECIEDFVNVYSAMYKNSMNYSGKELVRGTSNTNVEALEREFNQIISTTTDESIAMRFAGYRKNGALLHFEVGEGVPFLNAEDYRGENLASEKEIILAPFCSINRIEKSLRIKDGVTHYRIDIGRPRLEDVPQEKLDALMEEIIQDFSKKIESIEQYEYLEDKIEGLHGRCANAGIESKRDIDEDIERSYEQFGKIGKETDEFRNKLQTLLKGLCRQKEQEIDKAKEIIEKDKIRRAEEVEKRREEERIRKAEEAKKAQVLEVIAKAQENPKHAEDLSSKILTSYQKLLRNEQIYREKANILEVDYTKAIANTRIRERVEAVQNTIQHVQQIVNDLNITENDSQEVVTQVSKRVIPLMDGINFGEIQAEALPEIVDLHVKQSEHEIKKNLYLKVQKTIQDAKVQKYSQEKRQIANEKLGFFDRVIGKQNLQKERMNHIELKIQLEKSTQPEEKEKYNVRDMLVDLYVCKKTEIGFTSEISDLYSKIKQCYKTKNGKDFADEYIEELADKKIMQQQINLPVATTNTRRIFGKTKVETELLRQENRMLKNKILEEKQKGNRNFCKVSDEQDAIAIFDSRLNSIDRAITDKMQSNRDGSTMELF